MSMSPIVFSFEMWSGFVEHVQKIIKRGSWVTFLFTYKHSVEVWLPFDFLGYGKILRINRRLLEKYYDSLTNKMLKWGENHADK